MDDITVHRTAAGQIATDVARSEETSDVSPLWTPVERRAWLGRCFDNVALAMLEEYSRGLGEEPTAAVRSSFLWRIATERTRLLRELG